MQPSHFFATADGVNLAVYRQGSGTPFIFQHGLGADARQPAALWPSIEDFENIAVEMRGHGQSEAGDATRFSISTFVDDVSAFMEASGRCPAVVGGISMGAAMALRHAVLWPSMVRALVLVRPAWVAERAPANMRAYGEVAQLLRELPPEAALTRFLDGETARHLASQAPDNLASLASFFSRTPHRVTAQLLAAIAADGPGVSEAEISAIAIPTLIIGHQRDEVHPWAHAERLASLIPHAWLMEVTPKATDLARHMDDIRGALAAFLASLSCRAR